MTPRPHRDVSHPPFAVRGVIEGFYGRPWTQRQRLDMVEFIADRGMNMFALAPKDDPFLRRRWREPHPESDIAAITQLAEKGRSHGVRVMICLSPGLSMRYSDPDDNAVLGDKIRRLADRGISDVGLLLDDIPRELQHPADLRRYPDLVSAHIDVINRLFDTIQNLPERPRLTVCPTDYHGRGDEPYLTRLGAAIDPRIDVFHTGRAICSPTIDLADAATLARGLCRPPLYWDNYPVNDVAMTGELHLGPYRGRDRHLYRFARGVLANGMELFESSKIAVATIADYLVDPEGYDPESSWDRALGDVVHDDDTRAAFRIFADTVRGSCLAVDDAPDVTRALDRFAFRKDFDDAVRAVTDLVAYADRMDSAADRLLTPGTEPQTLLDEARPWVEAFKVGAAAIRAIAVAGDPARRISTAELAAHRDRLQRTGVRIFGDVLNMTLADLIDHPPEHSPTATPRSSR